MTAVLASYRGFDTLGETTVIFAAGIGVALMLGFGPRASLPPPPDAMGDHHVVLRVTAKLLIPLIALYALYVQFHGDLGAGGGFQAGVILAVAVILHALVFGLRETMAAVPPKLARSVAALGVLLYAGVGVVCIVNGGGFLDYDHLFPPQVEAMIPGRAAGRSEQRASLGPAFRHLFDRARRAADRRRDDDHDLLRLCRAHGRWMRRRRGDELDRLALQLCGRRRADDGWACSSCSRAAT